jgi:hypothetical protein
MLSVLLACFGEVCLAGDKELNGRSKSNPPTFKKVPPSAFINHTALVYIKHGVTDGVNMYEHAGREPFICSVTNEQAYLHWAKHHDLSYATGSPI